MAHGAHIDRLLDEWEEMRKLDQGMPLEQFVMSRLAGADSELVAAFQRTVAELEDINQVLEHVEGPEPPLLHSGLEPIPGYRLISRLGGGGFGEVWKAQTSGGFNVALKFVPMAERAGEIEERAMDVIKSIRHPHLLSVFSTWKTNEFLIIAMELADCTLLDRLDEIQKNGDEGIPSNELLIYMAEAAQAIDYLNIPDKSERERIVHGDIKPHNLLLLGGSIKVGDFGLARYIKHDITNHTGSLTFAYAAPERFDGATSSCSDQYSLAVAYCHLRGGRLPYEGSLVAMMDGHRNKPPDLSMIPVEERSAVERALAKHPTDRWGSCSEFVQNLQYATDRRAFDTVAAPRSESKTPPRKLRWWPWLSGFAAIALVALIAIVFRGWPSPPPPPSINVSHRAAVTGFGVVAIITNTSTTTPVEIVGVSVIPKVGDTLHKPLELSVLPGASVDIGWVQLKYRLLEGETLVVHVKNYAQPVAYPIPSTK